MPQDTQTQAEVSGSQPQEHHEPTGGDRRAWRIQPALAKMQSHANLYLADVFEHNEAWYTLEANLFGEVQCSCPARHERLEYLQGEPKKRSRTLRKTCPHVALLYAEGLDVVPVDTSRLATSGARMMGLDIEWHTTAPRTDQPEQRFVSLPRPLLGKVDLIIPSFGWCLSLQVEPPNPKTHLSEVWVPKRGATIGFGVPRSANEWFSLGYINMRQGRGDLVRKLKQYLMSRQAQSVCSVDWCSAVKFVVEPETNASRSWSGADILSIMRDGVCSACAGETVGLIPDV